MGGTGCDLVRGKLVESLQRDLSGTYHYLVGLKDALVGWGYGNYEGMKDFYGGLEKIASGNFSDGVKALFVGLGKLAVETPVDYIFTVGSRVSHSFRRSYSSNRLGAGSTTRRRPNWSACLSIASITARSFLKKGLRDCSV